MDRYKALQTAGEGAYGVVIKCLDKESGETVAIKKFKTKEDDATVREVKLLQALRHRNIVRLLHKFRVRGKLHLVFEYMERNMLQVLQGHPHGLPEDRVRKYIFQLAKAVAYCHRNNVLHRDLKPENLLVNGDGELKLCDFGVARTTNSAGKYTDYVATRWYRAPELLIGKVHYSMPVDVWALGCIMVEMLTGQPLFPGQSELDQIFIVQAVIGPLTADQAGFLSGNQRFRGKLQQARARVAGRYRRLEDVVRGRLSPSGMHLLKATLTMDPDKRISSADLLRHPYFADLAAADGEAAGEASKASRSASPSAQPRASRHGASDAPQPSPPASSSPEHRSLAPVRPPPAAAAPSQLQPQPPLAPAAHQHGLLPPRHRRADVPRVPSSKHFPLLQAGGGQELPPPPALPPAEPYPQPLHYGAGAGAGAGAHRKWWMSGSGDAAGGGGTHGGAGAYGGGGALEWGKETPQQAVPDWLRERAGMTSDSPATATTTGAGAEAPSPGSQAGAGAEAMWGRRGAGRSAARMHAARQMLAAGAERPLLEPGGAGGAPPSSMLPALAPSRTENLQQARGKPWPAAEAKRLANTQMLQPQPMASLPAAALPTLGAGVPDPWQAQAHRRRRRGGHGASPPGGKGTVWGSEAVGPSGGAVAGDVLDAELRQYWRGGAGAGGAAGAGGGMGGGAGLLPSLSRMPSGGGYEDALSHHIRRYR